MSAAIRTSIAAIAIVALITLVGLLSATTASAQCTTYTVINETRCELNLILYDGDGDVAGFHIYPTGATITLPPGFDMPAGFISNAGTNMPFDLGSWCTPCASISGWFETPSCCAIACTIDKASGDGCIITLKPCRFRCAP